MDEQRLSRMFRDAVGEVPPASFGLDEVVAASRRATAKRRHAVLGGAVLGVGVLAGTLVAGGLIDDSRLLGPTTGAEQAAPQDDAPETAPSTQHTFSAPSGGEQPAPRADSAGRGGVAEGSGGGIAAGGYCAPVDQELATELSTLLAARGMPATGPAGEVPRQETTQPCPAGTRAAAVPVSGGTLYVVLVPQATLSEAVQTAAPDGTRGYAIPLERGQLAVISVPAVPGRPAPLAEDLPALAGELASRR